MTSSTIAQVSDNVNYQNGRPPLPATFDSTAPRPVLVYQGAEALVYRTSFPLPFASNPASYDDGSALGIASYDAYLKHRPRKLYRHPILDAKLTRHRILSEARVLLKLRRDGLRCVPAVYSVDWDEGWTIGEWIDGGTVRALLEHGETDNTTLFILMKNIGQAIGHMHKLGVVHGDLTTSNLMLRHDKSQDDAVASADGIVLIDFGLSSQTQADEDRAVDLYVLERAFGSTHPHAERLWEEVLKAYESSYKSAKAAVSRLDEVRARGRKKVMLG